MAAKAPMKKKAPAKKKGNPITGPIKKGGFHAWLGKKQGEPITAADIAKGKAAGGHPAKMATFAQNAKKWKH